MKKLLLGLLFLSGTVAAQENDKSLVIIGGPTDLWTNNRLTGKDEFNAFTNLGVQFSKRKSANMDVVYTSLAGFQGEFFSPGAWNGKFISAGANMRYFFIPRKKTSVFKPFFQIGADAFARRDYGYPGNAYELNAVGGLGLDLKVAKNFSIIVQSNLAIPMAQSTEAGVKIASVRGSNNSTSFGLVYHFGFKAAKKKMDEEAAIAAAKAAEEAAAKAAAEAAEQDRIAREMAAKKAAADAKEKADAIAKAEAEAKAKAEAIAKAEAEVKAAAQLKADQEAMAETTILYMNNKWELTSESEAKLKVVASALTARPEIKVRIDGHSDTYGTSKNNLKASRFRAQGAAKFLVKNGIAASRLKVNAYGEDKPVASNKTKAGMTLNRRIEIRIIK
ncbi:OmpA family protein [Aquirufa lenticrescens]|uniref:OmpA family protein n=1 Tax=Aquirufa lenticrescens TaxID=2696560 RepID=UPI001CAA49DD|nr:OmpA family protein [Aquirufa lenticrescens]UAJ14000.1 OmpA family protein [Aquirufa lenticrescens]